MRSEVVIRCLSIGTLALLPFLYSSVAGVCALLLLVLAITGMVFLQRDIADLMHKNRALQETSGEESHAAMHDPLTGAANRRQFEQRLDELVLEANPSHVLMMLDLDRFKPVNDLHGHAAGDALLKEITSGLRKLVSTTDTVARLGGDEFAILLRTTTPETAEQTALRVLEFVKKFRLNWQGHRISVGTSIGMANIDRQGLSSAALMSVADEALYAAKEAGRGTAFIARAGDAGQHATFDRIEDGAFHAPTKSARSDRPEDGRRQELFASVITTLGKVPEPEDSRSGSRSRHDVQHWILTEPRTIGDSFSPGMRIREIIDDASSRADGGADLARWMLVNALNSTSWLGASELDRLGFVLPIPSQAIVTVPTLGEDLMRINALFHQPIRNLKFVLFNLIPVYNAPEIDAFRERLAISKVGVAYELRSSTLDSLAPLHRAKFDEVYLTRELTRNLRPGTPGFTAVESLLAITRQKQTDVVASGVAKREEIQHLASMGVRRFTGSCIAEPAKLSDVLSQLQTALQTSNRHEGDDFMKKSA